MGNRLISVAMMAMSMSTAAVELDWNGFLSVGGGLLTDKESTYLDFDDDLSFSSDSVFGLQVKSQINAKWSFTGQIVSRGSGNFETEIEWAFITYEGSDRSTVRLGLLRAPLYNYSDFLEVGYAYHWIRPPREVYGLIPFTNFNGVDYIYNTNWGDWGVNFQAYFGRKDESIDTGAVLGKLDDFSTRNWGGIIFNINKGWVSLRASHHSANSTADLNQTALMSLLTALNDPALDLIPVPGLGERFHNAAKKMSVQDTNINFSQFGFDIDYNNFLLTGEYTELDVGRSILPSQSSWYLLAGFNHLDWTWHVTYSELENRPVSFSSGLTGLGDPVLEALVEAVRDLEGNLTDKKKTVAVGFRYDLGPRTAFKLEWQRLKDLDYNAANNRLFTTDNDLVAFSIDMIF